MSAPQLKQLEIRTMSPRFSPDEIYSHLQKPSPGRLKSFFCAHIWAYYKHKGATRHHRVCTICADRQVYSEMFSKKSGHWLRKKFTPKDL